FSAVAILAVIASVAMAADPATTTTGAPSSAAPATTTGGSASGTGKPTGAPASSTGSAAPSASSTPPPAKAGAMSNQANAIVAFAGVGLAMALGL
ncbi:hypothetical protein BGZ93_004074, partial [Podila epicladia]